ncbi:unnamed protein product [Acanthoscelides obtectus]|uniref:Uncharacterized protein n=1 Tax=Acanthoscelides obtectus TaxID=200917 RepID=A0A9P0KCQ9_ACAOB|nr:unnamed protein product [Acanthoscelides obtectus]CAK1651003.1 hypothetical protein AOBTE_LOCUS17011 [Acanthoscelides obtectus]
MNSFYLKVFRNRIDVDAMTNENHTHRRKVVDKYYNRPPFTLKMKEPSVARSKFSEMTPIKKMRNKYHRLETSYRDIINHLENGIKPQEKDTTKEIIPKVIQSFQRVTPSKENNFHCTKKPVTSNNTSLHTFFRNKIMPLGKHIPDHKIMRHLLHNLAEDSAEAKYFDEFADTIPIKEVDINAKTKDTRIDKSTSTSGLLWPISEEPMLDRMRPKTKVPGRQSSSQVMAEQHRLNRVISNRLKSNQSTCETRPRHLQTSENYSGDTHYDCEAIPTKERGSCYDISKNQYQDSKEIAVNRNSRSKSTFQREKSFVKTQVEKYNRINGKSALLRKLSIHKGGISSKEIQNCTCPYTGLMNRAKKSFPKFDTYENSTDNNQEWSDNYVADTWKKEKITFPKETRLAVEGMMDRAKHPRIPLAKFVQNNSLQLRPAIELGDGEDLKTPYQNLAIPCTNNLLCDRGQHEGPCEEINTAPPEAVDRCQYRRQRHRHRYVK